MGQISKIIICDINVVVMLYIFEIELLDSEYSYGKIEIHETVLEELYEWKKSSAKISKFGIVVIERLITACEDRKSEISELSDDERYKYFRRISLIEAKLPDTERSKNTSKQDKTYLALARKYNCYIASQDGSVRGISKKILGNKQLLSFEDLLIDAFKNQKIDKEKIVDGLNNLDAYQEHLREGKRELILSVIKEA